ncbi:ABC transporter ATP-binding protein [Anaerobacillus alkaliphilus]|uniref:ABC transporter ATP-binding protein n=1 Tax=Anaerobacillus alkaliphilus TaxID=1548597 RepID=A0A4Q0VWS3_9BACI|nr:ABC transporter ATP-binding protein [Anaerobacillus alkaliphilus]RXJ04094.1 ABC transporter ATP-binding protein [Anaerobacillus alkaliphilus]
MLTIKNLSHSFFIGKKHEEKEMAVLKNVSFNIKKGEIATIVGRSGSGKSTLLNILSGYLGASSGQIMINGTDVTSFNETEWAKFRLENLGFIFQSFQLIPSLTTFENVELPLTLKGIAPKKRSDLVNQMLKEVGLEDHGSHFPNELSGGQQQRVSIARALITNPSIILADEPTGSLDSETERDILKLIKKLNKEKGITFFIITHDENVAEISKRSFQLHDGVLHMNGGVFVEAQ